MGSSNRHWPSMFKSKPHHQWQHDINSPILPSRSSPFSSGCEERSPDPKPRWNPKPEQIRILEAIFNSGMVNPPRDEIRRIRAQLQEYGQVGDANVFYWFQNRKSRSKHKLRLLHNSKRSPSQPQTQTLNSSASPSSSSSSSSPKSTKLYNTKNYTNSDTFNSNNTDIALGVNSSSIIPKGGPVAVEKNPVLGMFPAEPAFLFPVSPMTTAGAFEGFTGGSHLGFVSGQMMSNVVTQEQKPGAATTVGPCTGLLLSEIMNSVSYNGTNLSVKEHEEMRMKMLQQPQNLCYATSSNTAPTSSYNNSVVPSLSSASVTVSSVSDHRDQLQVQGEKIRVYVNEMEVEVIYGPFNVREAFGSEEAVLIDSAGQPVLTDEYGVLLRPLQHGASYYLI
ncbi:PREDICTED: WUSCHEL-related homeobox 9-like isoform X2 [Tarenaya hassleriana]|uniref:WUSCHEL-related homeobox 9-like isoform X2 n=1 Tax=Tarenaya hassleriana TaxID=28532 RepID=UPI00053C25D7|nr:PREDICTED: WUSCHEL-related homeobox 9-like isoform X2 [Tarenaya hassleriana]